MVDTAEKTSPARIPRVLAVTQELAARIAAVEFADLPEMAIRWAKFGILDTIGVTLAGSREDAVRVVSDTPGVGEAEGPALVLGTARRTSMLDACLINGVATHTLDYDDVNDKLGGHPSAMLVPALLALADAKDCTGADFITAYVAGFETAIRVGLAVNLHHYEKGWHPTATLGIFGTVAACSRLMRLDADATATALAVACSMATGIKANFGTMTKPLHVGNAVRNGLLATLLAARGFTANKRAFEHRQGFLAIFNGPSTYDVEQMFADWGQPFDVMGAGPGLKQYPCCGSAHAAIDCAMLLRSRHAVDAADIAAVSVLSNPRRLAHTDNPYPATGLEGKFSVQYVVARALLDGQLGLRQFEDRQVLDPSVRALMAKVRTGIHPDMGATSPHQWGAEVALELRSGETFSHRINHRVGRGPSDPMSELEIRKKFADCATQVLAPARADALCSALMALESASSVRTIISQLAAPAI